MKEKRKDIRKGNRHRPGYMTEYMRGWRARKNAEKLSPSSQAKPK